ncbi:uncharacterized protein LOC128861339 isoform X1 [Anastrepha ludens]|uniref:uncharacterized protein LOC128861339 isoform X1 n=2 Tax=Anastrepha ludens TaxID=28586 RepID=UPI0023AFA583|nr:uncharacterized protein LOC128861339 isoform X1 [Anastrepha ludens]
MTLRNRTVVLLYLLVVHSGNKVGHANNNHTLYSQINVYGRSVVYVNGQCRNTCEGGYIDENNACVPYVLQHCPAGYFLMNGLCYIQNSNNCLTGYYFSSGICYPTVPPPCEHFRMDPSFEIKLQPKPTTERSDPTPNPITRCPLGSVLTDNECRKILCPMGEYYQGQCLQPVCPKGTVWHKQRCQEPGYITTILDIENVFINEARDRPGIIAQENINSYVTQKPALSVSTTTSKIIKRITTTPPPQSTNSPQGICCTILTPRICKLYGKRWVCFNHQLKRCDAKLCSHPKIYLRVLEPIYDPPILVMPPNPPLEVCSTFECDNTSILDCSGCKSNRREKCSPYCYHYQCPNSQCTFVDLKEYCIKYPREFGCVRRDGCLWDWCTQEIVQNKFDFFN